MPERTVTICNKLGLHARAATRLVQTASGYQAEIEVAREAKAVNAKSILGVMMLAAAKGTEIRFIAEGDDADAALDALVALVEDRFGEGE